MIRPCVSLVIGIAATAAFLAIAAAQRTPPPDAEVSEHGRLKRSQIEQILKSDREKSIEDAGQMMKLAEELKDELEKNDKSVLSVTALRKAEEIEKLAKRVKGRLRRY